jgi:hypothetical protein
MRRLATLVCAVLVTGCGVLDDEGPPVRQPLDPAVYGPAQATARERPTIDPPRVSVPSGAVARELARGAIGVVDVTGAVGVRPTMLETSRDARLESLNWTRWGRNGAHGTGELRALTCQPTCANGSTRTAAATIRLSGVRECDGRRYYETAELEIAPGSTAAGEPPAIYVRAPC